MYKVGDRFKVGVKPDGTIIELVIVYDHTKIWWKVFLQNWLPF